jgi:Sulfotransferase family
MTTSDASPRQRPKVLYVMGAGRSGSTILGVTLGNCDDVFYAGELDKWLLRSGKPQLGGEERTRFWDSVRAGVPGAEELFGRDAQRYLERSSGLFRIEGPRARRHLRARYRRVTEDLYRAIAQTAGVTHVIDTGHYPLRARELQKLDGIELQLLFLIREPQSLIASWNREDVPEPTFSELKTNAYLWLTYALSSLVFLRQPRRRRLLVRHEDFLADPQGVLRAILEQAGSQAPIPDLNALSTGFPLQGNRLIRSDVVSLQARGPSKHRSSPLTALLQLPWRAIFSLLRPAATTTASRRIPTSDHSR